MFPHLHTLHLLMESITDYAANMRKTFPRVRKLVLGSTWGALEVGFSFEQAPTLERLECLWVTAGIDVEPVSTNGLGLLRGCRVLKDLRLCCLQPNGANKEATH